MVNPFVALFLVVGPTLIFLAAWWLLTYEPPRIHGRGRHGHKRRQRPR